MYLKSSMKHPNRWLLARFLYNLPFMLFIFKLGLQRLYTDPETMDQASWPSVLLYVPVFFVLRESFIFGLTKSWGISLVLYFYVQKMPTWLFWGVVGCDDGLHICLWWYCIVLRHTCFVVSLMCISVFHYLLFLVVACQCSF